MAFAGPESVSQPEYCSRHVQSNIVAVKSILDREVWKKWCE